MEAKLCKHEYILALSKKSIQNNMDLVTFDLFHQHEFNLNALSVRLPIHLGQPSLSNQAKAVMISS